MASALGMGCDPFVAGVGARATHTRTRRCDHGRSIVPSQRFVEVDRNARHDVGHSFGTHKHFNIFRVHLRRGSLAV